MQTEKAMTEQPRIVVVRYKTTEAHAAATAKGNRTAASPRRLKHGAENNRMRVAP